jgi:lysophospholipid acyltransferase (LPLAT)-like uncharacterized protein
MASSAKPTRSVHRKLWFHYLMLLPFLLIYRIWQSTLRLEMSPEDRKNLADPSTPKILLFWHNGLFTVPILQRRVRKGLPVHALISASRDGAWLEVLFRFSGLKTVRGSANFRGAQALKDLMRVVRSGEDIGITPDGSKGPCYEAKVGAAAVAKACRCPLILYGVTHEAAWRLRSWDRFFLPKPFSTVRVRLERIERFEDLNCEDPESASKELARRLMALQDPDPLT